MKFRFVESQQSEEAEVRKTHDFDCGSVNRFSCARAPSPHAHCCPAPGSDLNRLNWCAELNAIFCPARRLAHDNAVQAGSEQASVDFRSLDHRRLTCH
jgi:hypothetical protein